VSAQGEDGRVSGIQATARFLQAKPDPREDSHPCNRNVSPHGTRHFHIFDIGQCYDGFQDTQPTWMRHRNSTRPRGRQKSRIPTQLNQQEYEKAINF
jgi:hypothetical protein